MNSNFTIRHAVHPSQSRNFNTKELRHHFLINEVFSADRITYTYTHYDRFVAGGAMPITRPVELSTLEILKSDYFLERRELGIINVGTKGVVIADHNTYELDTNEALYLGRGTRKVTFMPGQNGQTPLFYYNSAPAHRTCPAKKVSLSESETVELGTIENANQRTIKKLIINGVVETCQLQMGLTELKTGSVWNTMPPHTHDRRMEVYMYFNIPEHQVVCHFMGEPEETRPIWIKNNQAVISPPWSIHAGAGTSNYSFIWGMAGENLDYTDMDTVQPDFLK